MKGFRLMFVVLTLFLFSPFSNAVETELVSPQEGFDVESFDAVQENANNASILTPSGLSKSYIHETDIVQIIFNRIPCDVSDDCVEGYEAVFEDGRVKTIDYNYIDVAYSDLINYKSCQIAFRAVFLNGELGPLSQYISVSEADFSPSTEVDISLSQEATMSTTTPIINVTAPIFGPNYICKEPVYGTCVKQNTDYRDYIWSFWQYAKNDPKTAPGTHMKYNYGYDVPYPDDVSKIMRFISEDEQYAFDINLNMGGGSNQDKNMKFFPVSDGKVAMLNYLGTACNGVLIQHDQKVDGLWIYSSYLHGKDLTIKKVGDRVSVNSSLGRIWNTGWNNYHLHVGIYAATGITPVSGKSYAYTAQLDKRDATFSKRDVRIKASSITVDKGTTKKSDAYAESDTRYNLTDASLVGNTVWLSSDKSIATVDGNGNIKGIAGGTTNVTVYFSGEKCIIPITVPDTTKPTVNKLSVSPSSIKKGSSVTISYKVSDSGGSGLKQVELWRGTSKSSLSHIDTKSLSGKGNGPSSGTFSNKPSSSGTYYYGIHVVDNSGNVGYDNGALPVTVK